ncbi:MAG: hypothetical protein AAF184_25195 [Pseudomonadota bacterium]
MLESLLIDLRHTVRSFGRDRSFTVTAVLILALGIGATSSIFSVAYGVLLRPLPYPQPNELVRLWPDQLVNKRTLMAIEGSVPAFEAVSGFGTWRTALTEGGEPFGSFDRIRGLLRCLSKNTAKRVRSYGLSVGQARGLLIRYPGGAGYANALAIVFRE